MWPFSSSTKLWKIGKHRVKKITVKEEKHYTERDGPYGTKRRKTKSVPKTRYKCIDCERTLNTREKFKENDYDCYDVIHA